MSDSNTFGYLQPRDVTSEQARSGFQFTQRMGRIRTVTPVKVVAVSVDDALGPVGTVDVQPLVNMVDGQFSNSTPHTTIYGLPFIRLQGGNNAIINDPRPGDIGLALICDRDISGVVKNKGAANPGSRRRFDLADGVYMGGTLNGTPNQYLQFNDQDGGLVLTDRLGGELVFTPTGMELKDLYNNHLIGGSGGIVFEDVNANIMTMVNTGLTLIDKNGNSLTGAATGWILGDHGGDQLQLLNNAVQLVDTSGNKIGMGAGGITATHTASGVALNITSNAAALTDGTAGDTISLVQGAGVSMQSLGAALTMTPGGAVNGSGATFQFTDSHSNNFKLDSSGITLVNANGEINIAPNGTVLIETSTSAITVGNSGVITISDSTGIQISLSPSGVSITVGANSIGVSSAGIAITGNVTVTGFLTATSSIIAGFGGLDQVGLQSHLHTSGGSGSPTSSPTPGT